MQKKIKQTLLNFYYQLVKLSLIHLSGKQTLAVLIIVVSLLVSWGKQAGFFESFELAIFDQLSERQHQSTAELDTEPKPILLVEITEEDLLRQKEWPLSDLKLAKTLQQLQKYQPKVIGLDLYRNIPQGKGQQELEKALAAENVISIYDAGARIAAPESVPKERQGFNDLLLDPDSVVRRHLLYAYQGDQEYYSFSLRLALSYLRGDGYAWRRSPDHLTIGSQKFPTLSKNAGGYQDLDTAGYQMLSTEKTDRSIDRLPISLAIEGAIPAELVRDRIVLIGSTAPSLKDYFRVTSYHASTPAQSFASGVEIHAQQVNQILNLAQNKTKPFKFWQEWQEFLWIILWSSTGAIIIRFAKKFSTLITLELAAGFILITSSIFLFQYHIWIPLASPLVALSLSSIIVLAYKLIDTSFVDALTGLPNRQQFFLHLRFAMRQANQSEQSRFAVLFLGIDRFNIINDSFGYAIGDQILTNLAQRIRQSLKQLHYQSLLARVGGDEFAVLLPQTQAVSELHEQADLLQGIIQNPFFIDGKEIGLSCSIGIVLGQPGENYEPEQLLRNAHTAMHRAKLLGRSSYEVFAVGMKNQMTQRLKMETDLRHALERQEMELYYQPLVDLQQGTLMGFEALVRWNHPNGIISPYHFIPVAEETGFIIPLGQWIIKTACEQMQKWHQLFPQYPDLGLSINLSGRQFSHPDLLKEIKSVLQNTQLSSDCLKMEVTESIAMQNVETSIDLLLQLKDLGLKLSIDDFGTGYSSLSYLCQFPIDTLKIDRSFVNRMQESEADYAIVQTIVTLSHALGMTIVAEGIETEEQRDILKNLNCEYGQGYLFAKPLQVQAAEELIESNQQFI